MFLARVGDFGTSQGQFFKRDPNQANENSGSFWSEPENQKWEVTVMPNPSSGNITVQLQTDIDEPWKIEVYNATGSLVLNTGEMHSGNKVYQNNWSNLSLNNGAGDVDTNYKNVKINQWGNAFSMVTATRHANNRDYWVVLRSLSGNDWYAYLLSPSGLSTTPVVSSIGLSTDFSVWRRQGQFKLSPSGDKLAFTNNRNFQNPCRVISSATPQCIDSFAIELFDFDRNTGHVLNGIQIYQDTANFYAVNTQSSWVRSYFAALEFSPNEQFLFVSIPFLPKPVFTQYDISSANSQIISNSFHHYLNSDLVLSLQLGPDRRLYALGRYPIRPTHGIFHFR